MSSCRGWKSGDDVQRGHGGPLIYLDTLMKDDVPAGWVSMMRILLVSAMGGVAGHLVAWAIRFYSNNQ